MINRDGLSHSDFSQLRELVHDHAGIKLTPEKKVMLETRLKRRMTKLGIGSYKEYCTYLFGQEGSAAGELVHLIDAVTTNKTDFFREKAHFEFLIQTVIPELLSRNQRELRLWSAGCSSGEEPYTLAMILSEYRRSRPDLRFHLLGSDISTAVLHRAKTAVYNADTIRPVPPQLRQKYFLRSRDRDRNTVRIAPEIRELVDFRRLNLMEDFELEGPVDIIFCRNVVIYFDRAVQERLFRRFGEQLSTGGYLFVGHSESLQHMDLPFVPVAPATYRKPGATPQVDFPEVYLQPGEIHVARKPAVVKTILGSCIAVTFWAPRRAIGAICHGVLPKAPENVTTPERRRYADAAIREILRKLESLGVTKSELQVKVFGGADVLDSSERGFSQPTVGHQNIRAAMDTLLEERVAIAASDVGGPTGRAIRFHSGTGEVLLRRLSHSRTTE